MGFHAWKVTVETEINMCTASWDNWVLVKGESIPEGGRCKSHGSPTKLLVLGEHRLGNLGEIMSNGQEKGLLPSYSTNAHRSTSATIVSLCSCA